MPKAKSAKRGEAGPQVVAAVDQVVAAKKLSKTAAFKEVAKQTGRSAGTVSVLYYKTRQKNGTGRGRRVRASGRASTLLAELAKVIAAQERELLELRKSAEWVKKARRFLLQK